MSYASFDIDTILSHMANKLEISNDEIKKVFYEGLANYWQSNDAKPTLFAQKEEKETKKPAPLQSKERSRDEPATKKVAEKKIVDTKSKPSDKKAGEKLVCCEDDCGTGIKTPNEQLYDGSYYCMKHLKKIQAEKKKSNLVQCTYIFPPKTKKAGSQCSLMTDGQYCRVHGAKSDVSNSDASHSDSHSDSHSEPSSDHENEENENEEEKEEKKVDNSLLSQVKEKFEEKLGKGVLSNENYTRRMTIQDAIDFISENFHHFEKIYDNIVSRDDFVRISQKSKSLLKYDYYALICENKLTDKLKQ